MTNLDFSAPLIMGILNVTPDSFSDGGDYLDNKKAIDHAKYMVEAGADIIDIGGESTRPGAARVAPAEQARRVVDVVAGVVKACPDVMISIDTTSAEVAREALAAGAGFVNDISAGREDPLMFELAANSGAYLCLMHMQGTPENMQRSPHYENVVAEVKEFLWRRAEEAKMRGVREERIIMDPGIGFGKTRQHNLRLLANIKSFTSMPFPVLLGASRKRFIASLGGAQLPRQRVAASCATTVYGYLGGVKIFRVHDVAEHREVLSVIISVNMERAAAVS